MNRPDFWATGLGTVVAGAAAEGVLIAADWPGETAADGGADRMPLGGHHGFHTKSDVARMQELKTLGCYAAPAGF
jgi:hypothetical protein